MSDAMRNTYDSRLRFSVFFAASVLITACGAPVDNDVSSSSSSVSSSSSSSSVAQCNDPNPGTPTPVSWTDQGAPLTGNYQVVVEQDDGLSEHTIYRPVTNSQESVPIVSWGNGGCSANGLSSAEFLAEIASHGYLVIANGAPNGSGSDPQDGSTHIDAIDWAMDENADPCSPHFDSLDVDNVAAMGYSCGGLMSLNAAGDPRLSTVVAWNSGLLSPSESVYASLHTPVGYFNGGSSDIAYENGVSDYQSITTVPVYHANLPVGHGGTYDQDNGGEYAEVGTAWLNWHLKDDHTSTGRGMFLGDGCGICNSSWVVEHKNFQ